MTVEDPIVPRETDASDMVGKALRLLALLGTSSEGAGVSQLARAAGYPVSTTHRLLGSLHRAGFVTTDTDTHHYTLGLRLFALGQRASQARGLAGAALPVMRRVTEHTEEPTLLSVLDGDHQLYVHHVRGQHQVRVIGEPGKHGPLHATSMGKCLIAFAPDRTRERLLAELPLEHLAQRTITDRAAFHVEIERVRRRGYAIADEEHEAGIRAVGVPILGPDGVARAALSTPAPAYRVTLRRLAGFVPVLREAAADIALVLPNGD